METILVVCLLAVLLIRWIYLRDRLNEIETRLDALSSPIPAQSEAALAPKPRPQAPAPDSLPPAPAQPLAPAFVPPVPSPQSPVAAFQAPADWESLVGGNWLNKLGVFVLVIGIALALGYSFKHLGPGGVVAISVAMSLAMLIGGVVLEPRERYRTFARGLVGGGWAALYFSTYAMHALDAARIIDNSWIAAFLLLAVAAGMIVHSLRYRSPTVTGMAYFLAFVTLGITPVTSLSVMALIPLAGSLLYVAQRFAWRGFALFGLIATYATCWLRSDFGAPLWQAQALFAVYWLLFEAFDILRQQPAMLPLNALGFLALSLAQWQIDAPYRIWQLLAGTAGAYLASAILRRRSSTWRAASTLIAALAAAAIFQRLDQQWTALGLLIEAELFYLAGVRLRQSYLRYLGGALFVVQLGNLAVRIAELPVRMWTPVAALDSAAFYLNRALCAADLIYSYAAAGMMALVAGYEVPEPFGGRAWFALGASTFSFGWWRRLSDFRFQAYGLAVLGVLGTAIYSHPTPWSLATSAALSYAAVLCALWSSASRFVEDEQPALRFAASATATGMLAALAWRVVPDQYLGLAWMALALLLLELGLRGLPAEFRRQSYALAALGVALVLWTNVVPIHNDGALVPRLIPVGAAVAAYAIAARARNEEEGQVRDLSSFCGTGFLLTGLWALLPPVAVGPAWAAVALVLAEFEAPSLQWQGHVVSLAAFSRLFFANFEGPERMLTVTPVLLSHYYLWTRTRQRFYLYTAAILAAVLMRFEMGRVFTAAGWAALALMLLLAGLRWHLDDLRRQSYALAALAFVRCWSTNFESPEMYFGIAGPVFIGCIVVACFYGGQLLLDRGTPWRLYFSLLATVLLAVLLWYEVSGSVLTVAWGLEGVALLAAGFPLRDRVPRLSGIALLLTCILKLFVWDLRHLETLPRIFSFIVLGLILVGVSWIYTRFRERVERFL